MINNVVLSGRFVRDPELKSTSTGTPMVRFCIANNQYAGQGKPDIVSFVDCTAWKGKAEVISKFFSKGDLITVSGRLKQDTWESPEGKKSKIEIIVDNFVFPAKKDGVKDEFGGQDVSGNVPDIFTDENIPF